MAGPFGPTPEFRAKQHQRDLLYAGLSRLDPGAIRGAFGELQGLSGGFLNQLLGSQALAGQQAATGIQAALGRAGLGSTGLGTALGRGALMGAAFQGNTLRSRMLMDLLNEAIGLQQMRANPFFQLAGGVNVPWGAQNLGTSMLMGGIQAGATAAGAGLGGGGGQAATARAPIQQYSQPIGPQPWAPVPYTPYR